MELLKTLFINLEQTQEKAISPEYELAYMALLNEREDDNDASTSQVAQETVIENAKEEEQEKKEEPIITPTDTTNTSANTTSNTSVLSAAEQEPNDVEMTEAADVTEISDLKAAGDAYAKSHRKPIQEDQEEEEKEEATKEAKPYSPSQLTDTELGYAFRRASYTSDFEIKPPSSPPPPYESNGQVVVEDKKELPKLKQRPSADTMMFGKQQDVTGKLSSCILLYKYYN